MFRGQHTHTIDAKGRISVPAKFREILSEKYGNRLIITSGLENCLVAYPPDEWRALEEKVLKYPSMNKNVSQFRRYYMSKAVDCLIDTQGRMLIPANLREHATLDKDVLFVGLQNKIEIWDIGQWNKSLPRDEMQLHEIRQAMAEFGL